MRCALLPTPHSNRFRGWIKQTPDVLLRRVSHLLRLLDRLELEKSYAQPYAQPYALRRRASDLGPSVQASKRPSRNALKSYSFHPHTGLPCKKSCSEQQSANSEVFVFYGKAPHRNLASVSECSE